jgi:hypothetical protein
MSAATPGVDERRAHPRVPTRLTVHCRRLGRTGIDEDVRVLDLSMGGVRIAAPAELRVGDVVELTVAEEPPGRLTLTGLVVGVRSDDTGPRNGHIAFTRLAAAHLEGIGRLIDLTATG